MEKPGRFFQTEQRTTNIVIGNSRATPSAVSDARTEHAFCFIYRLWCCPGCAFPPSVRPPSIYPPSNFWSTLFSSHAESSWRTEEKRLRLNRGALVVWCSTAFTEFFLCIPQEGGGIFFSRHLREGWFPAGFSFAISRYHPDWKTRRTWQRAERDGHGSLPLQRASDAAPTRAAL